MKRVSDPKRPRNVRCGIKDARGQSKRLLDPVKLDLFKGRSDIPPETLQLMADELLPGAKRQRLIQICSIGLSLAVVFGGTFVYFRYYSAWKGFDPVNVTIYAVQIAVIFAGPIIAYRMAKAKYAERVVDVMLKHLHCPHCAYDIRGLTADSNDGATVCPECGCAWRLSLQEAPGG